MVLLAFEKSPLIGDWSSSSFGGFQSGDSDILGLIVHQWQHFLIVSKIMQ